MATSSDEEGSIERLVILRMLIYLETSSAAEHGDNTHVWRLDTHSDVLIDVFVH